IKLFYIILTIVKAAYIVLVFMHLGDEKKNFKWMILGPYILFILYLLFICITESSYISEVMRAAW
ncbi:MAG: cytochrome C oxidase subunit IV family protein, partial [Crocinitomicaceae bacterium]|nr:cytochrome C oxidase subunit IV family protein [Crocinitomicaceae bacterium]